MKYEIITGNLPSLWQMLHGQLSRRDYSPHTIRHYRETVGQLDSFMRESGIHNYSERTGKLFLEQLDTGQWKKGRTCIARLDDVLYGRDFATIHILQSPQPLRFFDNLYTDFLADLKYQGLRDSTQKLLSFYCLEFLHFLEESGISEVEGINAKVIYDAVSSSKSTIDLCASIRKFLKFIFLQKIYPVDLSPVVPSIRRPKPIPSVYSPAELSEMIQVADLSTSKGLRDYAILLLASRLGMRVSDICNLELRDIHRERGTIEFVQTKTGIPIVFELLPDIKAAIDNYIANGRPQTESPKIFIRTRSPYNAIGRAAVTHVAERYFEKTSVNTAGRKRGPHALRMSLATNLVAEDVPYAVVQKVLGHQNALCFNNYVRLDIEKLRRCALDVPAATGNFKVWLYGGNDGGNNR